MEEDPEGLEGTEDEAWKVQLQRDGRQGGEVSSRKSLVAIVAICCPSKRASLEQFGHSMSTTATSGLDM